MSSGRWQERCFTKNTQTTNRARLEELASTAAQCERIFLHQKSSFIAPAAIGFRTRSMTSWSESLSVKLQKGEQMPTEEEVRETVEDGMREFQASCEMA